MSSPTPDIAQDGGEVPIKSDVPAISAAEDGTNKSDIAETGSIPTSENTDSGVSSVSTAVPGSVAPDGSSSTPAPTKPSGLKPPSKIGRLCSGTHQKAAVPAPTPTKPNFSDGESRMDYGRKLADVEEGDENELESTMESYSKRNRFTSIGSSAASMDGFWDANFYRRQSEAGLSTHSRYSDNSVILTEDTDSFIIGNRVWVGGTKPGFIAYIGETQFAPGDWAGIVLDQSIGKNDGSVGNVRYFQCEPKKGVFSRLTRLTREPIPTAELPPTPDISKRASPPRNDARRSSTTSAVSPTGSTRSVNMKSPPSLSASITSLQSSANTAEVKVGDRVIIKSSQGSKIGTLRFKGTTDFAPGEWCGVELDDPRGKNDGSVDGKRYFECLPNYGLFAPLSKVSKSPSKHKPGACIVHTPATGMRRAGSRESITSMTSMATSVASSARRVRLGITSLNTQKTTPKSSSTPGPTRMALQDVLREKQQHIEQLLKERDLDRSEIGKAAAQADDADKKLLKLRVEYDQYRKQCEEKLTEHSSLLEQLKLDRGELISQLDDERRKLDDLQFRFEESNINKTEYEAVNQTCTIKIKELEAKLAEEIAKSDHMEGDAHKLFEAEEALVKTREELDQIKIAYDALKTKETQIERQKNSTLDSAKNLEKQLGETKHQIKHLTLEKEKIESEYQDMVHHLQTEQQKLNNSLNNSHKEQEEVKKKSQDAEQKLIQQLNVMKLQMEQMATEKDSVEKSSAASLGALQQQIENIKNESKNVEKQKHQEISVAAESVKKLNLELNETKSQLQHNVKEMENQKASSNEIINSLRKELEISQHEVQKIQEEREKQNSMNQETVNSLKNEIKKLQSSLQNSEHERIKLASLTEESKRVIEKLTSQMRETDQICMSQGNEFERVKKELGATKQLYEDQKSLYEKNSSALTDLETHLKQELEKSREEISNKTVDLESVQNKTKNLSQEINDLKSEMHKLQEKNSELTQHCDKSKVKKTKVKAELEKTKTELKKKEGELHELKKIFEEASTKKNAELETLHQKLIEATNEAAALKQNVNKARQQLEEANVTAHERHTRDVSERDQKCIDLSKELSRKDEEMQTKLNELEQTKAQLQTAVSQVHDLQANCTVKNESESKLNEQIKQMENQMKLKSEEMEKLSKEYEKKLLEKTERLDAADQQLLQNSTEIAKRSSELISIKSELEIAVSKISNLQENCQDKSEAEKKLATELVQCQNQLKERTEEVELISKAYEAKLLEKCEKLDYAENALNSNATEIGKLKTKIDSLQKDIETNSSAAIEVHEVFKRDISDREKRFLATVEENANMGQKINQFETTILTLEEDACRKNSVIKQLRQQLEASQSNCGAGQCCGGLAQASKLQFAEAQITAQLNQIQQLSRELQNFQIIREQQEAANGVRYINWGYKCFTRMQLLLNFFRTQIDNLRRQCSCCSSGVRGGGGGVRIVYPSDYQQLKITVQNLLRTRPAIYANANVQSGVLINPTSCRNYPQFCGCQPSAVFVNHGPVSSLTSASLVASVSKPPSRAVPILDTLTSSERVTVRVPGPTVYIPRYIVRTVPVPQPPRIITVPAPPKIIVQRLPPRIIVRTVPKVVVQRVPVFCGPAFVPCPVRVSVRYIPSPPKIIVQRVPMPPQIIQAPPRVLIQKELVPGPPRVYTQRVVCVAPPKCVRVPVPVNRPVPFPLPGPVRTRVVVRTIPPKIIIQRVPKIIVQRIRQICYPRLRPCPTARIIVRKIQLPPKIIVQRIQVAPKIIRVPFPVVQRIPVPMPPKIVRQCKVCYQRIPVPIPLPPRVITRTVVQRIPVPMPIPLPPRIISQCKICYRRIPIPIPLPPRVVSQCKLCYQRVPVPVYLPPRIITRNVIQRVPVPVPVPMPPRIITRIQRVPVPVPMPPKVITQCKICLQRVPVPIPLPPRYFTRIQKVSVPRPVPVPVPIPPKIISLCKVCYQRIPVPVLLPPRIINRSIIQRVPVPVPLPPKIIRQRQICLQRIPVPYPLPPRIITRNIIQKVPVPVPTPVPVPSPPRIITRVQRIPVPIRIPVPVPLPPRIISQCKICYQKVPVPLPPKIIRQCKICLQRIPVPYPLPPRIITRNIIQKVPVPVPTPVPVPSPPRIITRVQRILVPIRIPVPVPLPPRIISQCKMCYQKVPVPLPPKIIRQCKICLQRIPVPYPLPPRIITRNIIQKVLVPVPTPVPVPSPPRIITRVQRIPVPIRIPVPVPLPPRIISQCKVCYKKVPVPLPPKIIRQCKICLQRIPVPYPLPPRIITRNIIQKVPVPVPTPVPVPSPPRIITRVQRIPVPIRIPVPVPLPPRIISQCKVCYQKVPVVFPPRIITQVEKVVVPKIVIQKEYVGVPKYIPVPSPPKIIVRKVFIPSPPKYITIQSPPKVIVVRTPPKLIVQRVPKIIIQRIAIRCMPAFVPCPKEKIIVQRIQLPPKLIIQRIPVPKLIRIEMPPKLIPIVQPPRLIVKRISIPSPPRVLIKEVVVRQPYPVYQPPRIIVQRIPVPLPPKIIPIPLPPQRIPIPIPMPPRYVFRKVPIFMPPRVFCKKVPVFMPPKIIVRRYPVFMPPRVITKFISVPQPPRLICQKIYVRLPPKIFIRKVSVSVPVPVRIPVPVPLPPKVVVQRIVSPPRYIFRRVPIYMPPRTFCQKIFVPMPPKIITRRYPVIVPINRRIPVPIPIRIPIPMPPRIICRKQFIRLPPRVFIQRVPVTVPYPLRIPVPVPRPVYVPPKVFVQRVPQYIFRKVPVFMPPRIVCKKVLVPMPPRVLIRKTPVFIPPQIFTRRVVVPIPMPPRRYCQKIYVRLPPKICIQRVPVRVPLPPRVIVQRVVSPPRIIRVPSRPRVVVQRIVSPPRIIPIYTPPKVIVQKEIRTVVQRIPTPTIICAPNFIMCPTPRVVIQKVAAPTRVIIQKIPSPPQVIVQKVQSPGLCSASLLRENVNVKTVVKTVVPAGYVPIAKCNLYCGRGAGAANVFLNAAIPSNFVPYPMLGNGRLTIASNVNSGIGTCMPCPAVPGYRPYPVSLDSQRCRPHMRTLMYRLQYERNMLFKLRLFLNTMIKNYHVSMCMRAKSQAAVLSERRSLNTALLYIKSALQQCMTAILIHNQANNNNVQCNQLIEDKKAAEGQIQFLNSIIVDMQQKYETQKAQIEILEAGGEQMLSHRRNDEPSKKEIPPRMYCDICEEFDLHETEDCPKQSSEEPPMKPPGGKERVKPAQRPYCDICEAFGHATEDCVDDTTF